MSVRTPWSPTRFGPCSTRLATLVMGILPLLGIAAAPTAATRRERFPGSGAVSGSLLSFCWDGGPIIDEVGGVAEESGTRVADCPTSCQTPPPSTEPPVEEQRSGRRPRPRGRRQRGPAARSKEYTEVDIISFNGSGAAQCLAALRRLRDHRRRTAAVLIQEHQARGDALADLQAQAATLGWKVAAAHATDGKKGGSSSGTAVVVPLHRGWSTTAAGSWDLSPRGSPGKLSGAWVQAGPRSGLLLMSVYCWTNEGPSDRNIALIETGLAVAAEFGGPWAMAGDFNMTPTQLRQAAGRLLDRAGAVIRAPDAPTNFPGRGEAREIDYFLIDHRIAGCVSRALVHGDIAGHPHRAVVITLTGRDAPSLIQAAVRPKAFPRERPIGCPRRPVLPRGMGQLINEHMDHETLTKEWSEVAECIEAELSRECDLVDSKGWPLKAYGGRGGGFEVKWKQLLPARIVGKFGQANTHLHQMAWVLNRLEELLHLAVAAEAGGGGASARRAEQWHRIVHNLARPNGNLSKLIDSDRGWDRLRELALRARHGPRGMVPDLRETATKLQLAISDLKLKLSHERRAAWREWVGHHIGRGGGGAPQIYQKESCSTRDDCLWARCSARRFPAALCRCRLRRVVGHLEEARRPRRDSLDEHQVPGHWSAAAASGRRRDEASREELQLLHGCRRRPLPAPLVRVALRRSLDGDGAPHGDH